MKRWIAALLILVLLTGTLSACGSDDSVDRSFFFPLASQPKSLDPQICGDPDTAQAVGSLFEGLVRMDENGQIQPGVASSMEVSSDALTYTFHLRPDAKWHVIKNFSIFYGENCEKNLEIPVTAEDFVFTFQRIFTATTNTPGADTLFAIHNAQEVYSGEITLLELGVKALDAQTLVISLDRPCGDLLTLLTQPICAPCNRLFFEMTKGKYGLGVSYTMCNGPFYLSKWNIDSNFILRRNPDYKGDLEVVPSALNYYFNSDPESYIRRVNEGIYDAAPIRKEYLNYLSTDTKKIEIRNITCGLAFNCNDPMLSNSSFRMALCSAFSAETLNIEGKTPAKGILPSGCVIGGENYRSLAGDADFPEENRDRAQLFMQFALRELDVSSVTLTILCTAEYEMSLRKVIQHWQKIFGVSVAASTKVCTLQELESAQHSGDYQIAFMPITATSSSAIRTLYNLSSGEKSVFGLEDPEYDGYIRSMLTSPSAVSAAACCKRAESYLIRTGVFYPLFEDTSVVAVYRGADGITCTPCGEYVQFTAARKLD